MVNPFLARLASMTDDDATDLVLPCCVSQAWAREVAAGRPYADVGTLLHSASAAVLLLGWDDVLEALAAHPRIGDRPRGEGTEADWSRSEQSGMAKAGDDVRERLAAGNVAYEERFGHHYLVCATGLTPEQLLDRLVHRLGNDGATEKDVVRHELSRITALRLTKLIDGAGRAGEVTP